MNEKYHERVCKWVIEAETTVVADTLIFLGFELFHNEGKGLAHDVLNFLNVKTGRSYKPLTPNLKMIQARLKESSVDDIKSVIALKCRQWADDPKMEKYLRPKTLFNATNFAQYSGELNQKQKGKK